jgi:hypothetical protein
LGESIPLEIAHRSLPQREEAGTTDWRPTGNIGIDYPLANFLQILAMVVFGRFRSTVSWSTFPRFGFQTERRPY